MSDLRRSRYSSHSGNGQQRSPARSPASRTSASRASSFPIAPIATWPSATTTAPVSVAMSITAAGLKRRTYDSASHRIRRPSASVLMISIVLPKWLFTTSPGFTAWPDGRFSVAGMSPTTLTFGLSSPSVSKVPITGAARLEHDEPRLLVAALGDGEQRPHPFLLQLGPVEHGELEAVLIRQLLRPLRQVAGGADVAGQHLQLAGEPVPRRDGVTDALAGRDFLHLLWIAHERDALDFGLHARRPPGPDPGPTRRFAPRG